MMGCGSSALVALTTAEQTIAAGAYVPLATNAVMKGLSVLHAPGSTTVAIGVPGVYLVSVSVDVLPAAAGGMTVALYNNGVAVPGADASFTGVADSLTHVSFTTLVRVRRSCCAVDNSAALQIGTAQEATFSNACMTVLGVA